MFDVMMAVDDGIGVFSFFFRYFHGIKRSFVIFLFSHRLNGALMQDLELR